MPDNTTIPGPGAGDIIRTLDKGRVDGAKTEVVIPDLGGGDGRSESLATFPIPIALDWPRDDDDIPLVSFSSVTMDAVEKLFRQLMAAAGQGV